MPRVSHWRCSHLHYPGLGTKVVQNAPSWHIFGYFFITAASDRGRHDPAIRPVQTTVVPLGDAYARVQRMAAANDVSIAWVIRQAVQRFLDSHEYQTELPFGEPEERQEQADR